jgi:hypothetical protein
MSAMKKLLWLLPLVAGCAGDPMLGGDPMQRPGTWTATGDNDANLRAMIADPRDLQAGANAPNGLAVEAVPAVGRLLSGKLPPLPDEPTSQLGGGSGGAAPQGGGNAGPQ